MASEGSYICAAVRVLRPDCNFTIVNGAFTYYVHEEAVPTWEEINAKVQEIKDAE